MELDFDTLSKEQKIMVMMRKALTRIIRETTPSPGMEHPLTAEAVEDIRQCLFLISARERELLAEKGEQSTDRPRYVDEAKKSQVLKFTPRPK